MSSSTPPRVVAIVGLCGAGKSEVSNFFVEKGLSYLRFGQITLDEIQKRGLPVNEANEKMIREGFRKEHGMAAFAIVNLPVIDQLLAEGKRVLVDGLYSWSEYKVLKDKYGADLSVIAVYAPPEMRYDRLENRNQKHENDASQKYRSFTREEAHARDFAEIENIEKAGPIVMANYTLVNTKTLDDLKAQTEKTWQALS